MDSVLKAVVIYVVLWLLIRISGRRALAELSTFDFILFLVIGGATQRALIGQDYSLTNAFIVITTLIVVDIIVGLLERDFRFISKIIKGVPTILVDDGHLLTGRMRRARVTSDEIMERARTLHGLETLEQIKYAILEASGDISIIPRDKPARPRKNRPAKISG
jgi:uncharacterized membrane protein YcaP (DUF421 family)